MYILFFPRFKDVAASSKNSEVRRAKLVTLAWQRSQDKHSSRDIISLPVPYELPPQSYSQEGSTMNLNSLLVFSLPRLTFSKFFEHWMQMCHGHGIGGTQKKMCTVKCGHGKFSCMLFKSLDFHGHFSETFPGCYVYFICPV